MTSGNDVVVPVGDISRLTSEALSAAVSLGDEVLAVTMAQADADPEEQAAAEALRRDWELWNPGVRLVTVPAERR